MDSRPSEGSVLFSCGFCQWVEKDEEVGFGVGVGEAVDGDMFIAAASAVDVVVVVRLATRGSLLF